MSSQLILVPTINSGLSHLSIQLDAIRRESLLAPVNILLPTVSAIHDLRQRLGDTMGVQFYQFYRLGNAVLDEAGVPVHELNDTAIRRLIRRILAELDAEKRLTTFSLVQAKPGFVEVILDWLREMKSQGIDPQQYAEFARESGGQKDRQLAEIYLRYQSFLQTRHYSDADGLLWLTAETLERDPGLFRRDGSLFVSGFDQFTPVQLRILRQLAERFNATKVYLLWDPERSTDSLALARLNRARQALLETIPMQIETIANEAPPSSVLAHLHQNLFEAWKPQPADQPSLQMIEAPSREAEVRRALREIKRLLLRDVAPAKIAILVPSVNAYRPIIGAIATEYGVPVEYERPLQGNPAVAALVNLLKLAPSFPWQLTLDALRSPNIRQSWLSEEQIGLLDQLSRERPVLAGRDQWAFAVRPLTLETQDNNDDDFGPPPLVARLDPIDLMAINDGMTAFFEHLTPADTASYRDYTWWLQTAIIGFIPDTDGDEEDSLAPVPTLDLFGCSLEGSFALRDRDALEVVMRALRRLLASSETVPLDAEISWETYRDELLGILQVMQISPDPLQANVRFGRLDEGRARVCDYLFVLGLSEGEFPTPPPVDALYAPLERETHPLPLIRFSPADDASLWWQVIGNVNTQLFLLRPYIDANGAPWQTSPYWDAVRACFCDLPVENIPIAEQRLPMDAANQHELLVALAQTGATAIPESLRKHWLYAQHAEGVMQRRQGYLPPGEFEGVIQAPSIQAELAARYGDLHVWSASRLNRYANCPYGFFAEQVLKLEALQDTEEGLDAMQRGSLLHAILEEMYKRLTRLEIAPTQDSVETILGQLEASCAVVFPSAPQRYGFRPSPLWEYEQKELLRLLRALVVWECEENGSDARFRPYLQEAGFGIRESGPQPLEVMGEKAQFRLRGLIDRIDRDPAGNLRVIDYKSGSTTWSPNDLKKGLALQTTLYALAAERFWSNDESRVAESHYWHIPSREASGSLKISACVTQDELADAIIQQAAWNIFQIRSGVFPSAPGKPVQGGMSCNSRCDFAPICRVSRLSIGKARRGGLG